ncbi:Cyclin-b1-2 [Thalictrum thalictroides]|uniref:Cyclin-b1-2 n=1 Tax=Thalictrum thalictroides TaxID=46969 RepID=A0A7J6X8Z5_THATH|nr:Cyclin-b1-2 [Thalictrum thalictroides]
MEEVSQKKAIAHEVGGVKNDALRFGLHGVKSDILDVHPLQSSLQSFEKTETQMQRSILERTYGYALPMKMDLERQILARVQRPPGLPSSMLGYEALTGSLDVFDCEDYHSHNDPRLSETSRPADMHHGMEVRLGLSKGPVAPTFI